MCAVYEVISVNTNIAVSAKLPTYLGRTVAYIGRKHH